MKGSTGKGTILTFAQRCKNILASNWKGQLNTIKADSKGSKGDIHSSKVMYMLERGRPYIWVPEKDLHNVNTMIDERGSFSVTNPYPGPLASLLRSINKSPARVALTGDILPLKDTKAKAAVEKLREVIMSDQKAISESSYTVSGVLTSSNLGTSRSENLVGLLEEDEKYVIHKLDIRSCIYIDGNGGTHEVEMEDMAASKADLLAPFSPKIIDGINQSGTRRRALMLFCLVDLNENAKDAFMFSIDRKGFDVLAKVQSLVAKDGFGQYQWKEFRFKFNKEASDAETFCRQLVAMEAEAVKKVSGYSGLA